MTRFQHGIVKVELSSKGWPLIIEPRVDAPKPIVYIVNFTLMKKLRLGNEIVAWMI
jgi:hypothetical protein